eukprot:TRINITY_DN28339_c0_g1_i1.p1 TRINITY_DN28339_c0_g1~~TRINITY_DN28339_c0_g1_i1.p1  ORF type:complete len:297 (-),score=68.23 TRINITY_DN28339_c0_g1_i1:19-909(-)
MDVTSLFQSYLPPGSLQSMAKTKTKAKPAPFSTAAAECNRSIAIYTARCARVNSLSKSPSLFMEQTVGQESSQIIAEINAEITRIQTLLQNELPMMTNDFLSQYSNKDCQQHANSINTFLRVSFRDLTTTFQNSLRERASNLQKQEARKSSHILLSRPVDLPANSLRYRAGHVADVSNVQNEQQSESDANGEVSITVMQGALQERTSRTRLTALQQIEKTMGDLQSVFRRFASIVAEQGEMVQRIDTNIAESEVHVDAAHSIIQKEFERIMKNRSFIIKIFAVIIVLVIIWLIFFV